ncbi:MAG: hypothetical protein A3B70_01490 [Deltaproteobacteria bacterium RIFCSPHIGHO2_02_FULL_40_11]|nr:MAG: hypothetical protein A3B70_01490 [Deltaproteobacteria bacterium RIFCSPHIGHO2_02_FULL_40_11]
MKLNILSGIYLSEFQNGDEAALVEYLKVKKISYFTLGIPYPYKHKDALWWIKNKKQETKQQKQPVAFAIRQKNGELIGGIGFDGLKIGKSHKAALGYWLAKPYWGQGIMTACAKKLCGHAFKKFKVTKIIATCNPNNIGSERVLIKGGFRQEGYLKKDHIKNGKYRDSKLFALIRTSK